MPGTDRVCDVTKTKALTLINVRLASLWVSPFLLQVRAFVPFAILGMGYDVEQYEKLESLSNVSAF